VKYHTHEAVFALLGQERLGKPQRLGGPLPCASLRSLRFATARARGWAGLAACRRYGLAPRCRLFRFPTQASLAQRFFVRNPFKDRSTERICSSARRSSRSRTLASDYWSTKPTRLHGKCAGR
jgi:hypothetical protein